MVFTYPELIWVARALGAGIAIGFAAIGGGIGIGLAANGALGGVARNPETGGTITTTLFVMAAFAELSTIAGLVIAFLLIFAFPVT